jgi:hypothetical protein
VGQVGQLQELLSIEVIALLKASFKDDERSKNCIRQAPLRS